MYRKVMLSLTLLSLILLSLIAWKVGVFKEIADLPFSTLVSNMVRNTYFSGMACSIISVVVIYKWQVWYSKRKLKQDFRCNECIQDIYSGIEIVSNYASSIPKETLGSGTVNKVLTKVQIMSKDVEFSKTKKVAKFVTI